MGKKTADDLQEYTVVPAWAAETDGVVQALEGLGADRTRVEVVPARDHREAARLAPHVNLARGWNRQLDMERARLFYDGTFSAATYRSWLDHWAVGFVVLPSASRTAPEGEARLVATRAADWLEPVWQDPHWRVYRVRDAVPLVSTPATVVRRRSAAVLVRVPRPGSVTVRVAWSPWLRRRRLPGEGGRVHPADGYRAGRVPDQLGVRSFAGAGASLLTVRGPRASSPSPPPVS